jgi:hypothetical protein
MEGGSLPTLWDSIMSSTQFAADLTIMEEGRISGAAVEQSLPLVASLQRWMGAWAVIRI